MNSLRKTGHTEISKKALGPGRNGRGNRVWENWKTVQGIGGVVE